MIFKNTGLDDMITKSFIGNRTESEQEELSKALNKNGLVQVQTTVNGKMVSSLVCSGRKQVM